MGFNRAVTLFLSLLALLAASVVTAYGQQQTTTYPAPQTIPALCPGCQGFGWGYTTTIFENDSQAGCTNPDNDFSSSTSFSSTDFVWLPLGLPPPEIDSWGGTILSPHWNMNISQVYTVQNGISLASGATTGQTTNSVSRPDLVGGTVTISETYLGSISGTTISEIYSRNVDDEFDGDVWAGSQKWQYNITSTYNIVSGIQTYSETYTANTIYNKAYGQPAGCTRNTAVNENVSAGADYYTGQPINSPSSLTIETTSLNDGYFQQSNYSSTVSATGGTPPYTWTYSPLPAGLQVTKNPDESAQLSGTFAPNAEDTQSTSYFPPPSSSANPATFDRLARQFQIVFTVTDSTGATASSGLAPGASGQPKPLSINWTCGGDGEADDLIQQYVSPPFNGPNGIAAKGGPRLIPRCMDITPTPGQAGALGAHSAKYLFSQLNTSNHTVSGVALLSNSLLHDGLDTSVRIYGGPLPYMSSGFRPPQDQLNLYQTLGTSVPPGGRHMFGDAVDLTDNDSGQPMSPANYDALTNAAVDAGAETERNMLPKSGKPYKCSIKRMLCVHADWKGSTTSYAQ